MAKLEGLQLLKLLQQTLSKHQVAYDDIVESFDQVPAAIRRAQGHQFTMAEHVRGLILAQLSNQRPWGPIARNMARIDKIFLSYEPQALKAADAEELVRQLRTIKCGNRMIKKQMEGLKDNINVLEEIDRNFESIDAFVVSAPAVEIAKQ